MLLPVRPEHSRSLPQHAYCYTRRPTRARFGPQAYQQYVDWRNDRLVFNEKLKEAGSDAQKERWQRKYMMGRDMDGRTFAGHETKLRMQEFKRR